MKLLPFLKVWFITYIFFFVIDMFTHIIILGPIFASQLAGITKSTAETNMPVIMSQTIIISMATVFLVWKTKNKTQSISQTAAIGAVIGLLIYGIHEMTSYASIPNWPLQITWLHTVMGVVQMAIVAVVAKMVIERFGPRNDS